MRLAILIIGAQNSGKTSTIKHLIAKYNGKTVQIMKAGWNNIFFNPIFKSSKLHFYCIPASPSESDVELSTRFAPWTWLPETIIMAEQVSGRHYTSTMNFLSSNGYNILRFDIQNVIGPLDWERFDAANMTAKLDNRADEIVADIKQFLKTNGIV